MAETATTFEAQCARDAASNGYGSPGYAEYLEESSKEHRDFFLARGDTERAEEMMTQSLGAALRGNDGD